MKLNLGCSDSLHGGEWINVDILPNPQSGVEEFDMGRYLQTDLALPWPWDDSSVDEIYAADIFEHIADVPRLPGDSAIDNFGRHWSGRVHVMNESWRVLKPSGILTIECPDAAKGAGQWQDPQHVSPWTPNALQYYTDGSPAHKRFAAAYGITARFKVLEVTERKYSELIGNYRGRRVVAEVYKFKAVLEAVKDGK